MRTCEGVGEESEQHSAFIGPGADGPLQSLDLAALGALKAEWRALCRFEMSPRDDKRMTKADSAAVRMLRATVPDFEP